jgi:hypothetical protein
MADMTAGEVLHCTDVRRLSLAMQFAHGHVIEHALV